MTTRVSTDTTKQPGQRSKPKATKARAPRKPGATGPITLTGRPPNFERLERFFASQTALARALGVHRDTIRTWQEGRPTRLRASSVARVSTICAVAEQVARYLPSDTLVGEWLLAPQLTLSGSSAAALIQREPEAYQRVLDLVARDAQPVPVVDISDLPTAPEPGTQLPSLTEPAPDPDADPEFLASLG
jgi:hypothetical protein